MVRLKEDNVNQLINEAIFQFLYGTIKSLVSNRAKVYPNVFQFLYGTIKSAKAIITSSNSKTPFNSYMVRLKE